MLSAVAPTGVETKVEELREILDEAGITPSNGEKLLVFTEFKDTLDFLRQLLRGAGLHCHPDRRQHEPQDMRRKAEADFRDRCQVMVATEAAGEGINLQFCAYMVNYDLPWVPDAPGAAHGPHPSLRPESASPEIYNLVAADTREGAVVAGLAGPPGRDAPATSAIRSSTSSARWWATKPPGATC